MTEERVGDSGEKTRYVRRSVPADLVEAMPENGGLMHWILASPMVIFLAWVWVDIFAHFSPIPSYWIDVVLGLVVFAWVILLPLGYGAFFLVTSFPRIFSNAGWDVQPLEHVNEAEMYTVHYQFQARRRAPNDLPRAWVRASQGWVYIEIATILVGGVAMIPIFLSVSEFGFGQY